MGNAICDLSNPNLAIKHNYGSAPNNLGILVDAPDLPVSQAPIQGKVKARRRRVDDGKVHFVQNLAKNPETGVFLYRFSHRGRISCGSTGCYRLSEARNYLNALRGKLSLEGVGVKQAKVITFRQVFDAWMTERAPQRTEKYVKTIRGLVTNHALPILGGLQLTQVDSTAISTVLNRYLSTHARAGTNTLALHIGALLSFAVEKAWIEKRPKIPMVPVQKVSRPVVSKDGLDQFLEAIDAQGNLQVSFLVRAQILMGMRNHEARLMKWSGLRLDQRVFIPDKTKNGDAPVMPIPDVMLPWFDKMGKEVGTFGLICPGETGEPRAHDFTRRYIRKAAKAVGLPETLTDHRLRASFANILNRKGVPLPTIQKLMRHSKVETTMIYIETREDEMRVAINLMGDSDRS